MDAGALERLMDRPEIAAAEARLRELVATAAHTTRIGAGHLLRDHYRRTSDPRHPVTRFG